MAKPNNLCSQLHTLESAWARRHAIARSVAAGAKMTDLARKIGCSPVRIRQMNEKAKREIGYASPLEMYLDRPAIATKEEARIFLAECARSGRRAPGRREWRKGW